MVGSKHLDCSLLPCRRVVVADGGGNCDTIFYKAPQGLSIEAVFHGKAAHAGLAPETGINAVVMASKAIAQMQIGRIDEETTTNIGRIEGGGPNNVVPDTVRFTAEMRSHNGQTLEKQRAHMERCCMEAAAAMGGSCEFLCEQTYPALSIDPQGELCRKVQSAMEKEGISAKLEPTGGGSDANVMDGFGYECVILGVGMENVHSTKEQLNMNELWKATRVMRHLMDA